MQRLLLGIVLALFSILTGVALWEYGYWGILTLQFQRSGTAQVFTDLVISLSLVLIWMWQDAKANGRNIWPWLIMTLLMGSFGPLFYLLFRPEPVRPVEEITT